MLGAAGALCCMAVGTAVGGVLRDRRMNRLRMLRAEIDALGGMRTLLEEERPALPRLLKESAAYVTEGPGGDEVIRRLTFTAEALTRNPLCELDEAYAQACARIPAPWEKREERVAMEMLFRQLGSGTACMRGQAVAACLRRLRPEEESARAEAETGGRLWMQLGMLLGLMAGILFW